MIIYFLIFLGLAILLGNNAKGWFFYGMGAVIQYFVIYITQTGYESQGYVVNSSSAWGVYVTLLIITAAIMLRRKSKQEDDSQGGATLPCQTEVSSLSERHDESLSETGRAGEKPL